MSKLDLFAFYSIDNQGIQAHWHPIELENTRNMDQRLSQVAAVDGSRAIRALSSGADWVIA